jgi:hypothetical protein
MANVEGSPNPRKSKAAAFSHPPSDTGRFRSWIWLSAAFLLRCAKAEQKIQFNSMQNQTVFGYGNPVCSCVGMEAFA